MRSSRSLLKQLSSLISTPKGKTTFAPLGTLRNPVHALPSLSRTPFPYLPILATLSLLSFPQSARTSSSHTHFLNLFMGNEMSSGGAPIGREEEEKLSNKHFVLGTPLRPPYPEGFHRIVVATGCYWGAEKGFWRLPGVYSTAVGYAGGETKNPSYREACSGLTGHTEAVHIVWDPSKIGTADILKQFWECHNPTQVNGQGGDHGTQYRSAIYTDTEEQEELAHASKSAYEKVLGKSIATEIRPLKEAGPFYFAHEEYQQYLSRPGARQYCSAEPQGKQLGEYSTWAPEKLAAKPEHQNKLPAEFWKEHGPKPHCVIRSPNEQHVWPPAGSS